MSDRFLSYVLDKKAKIVKQIQKLEMELADLEKSIKLYKASGAAYVEADNAHLSYESNQETPGNVAPNLNVVFPSGTTVKDRVRAILRNNKNGLTASQILWVLQQTGLHDLQRESLSPQLSRLKNDGEIEVDHRVWRLKYDEGNNFEPLVEDEDESLA